MNTRELREVPGAPWPELPWREWEPTVSTLHLWLQIVGKVRLTLAPPLNHWWHITLYVSSRGMTTSAIPYGAREFQVDLDFVDQARPSKCPLPLSRSPGSTGSSWLG
jgi:hypothetical protein